MKPKPNIALPKTGIKDPRKHSTALVPCHNGIVTTNRDGIEDQNGIEDVEPCRPRPSQPARAPNDTFATPAWRELWNRIRRSGNTTCAYIAGCSGTMTLGHRLGMPTLKAGTGEDVEARVRKLNQQRYGSLVVRDGTLVKEEGYDNWRPCKLSAPPCHPASPVRVLPRSLLITLPAWLTRSRFEAMLNGALEPIRLAHLAATPAVQDLCRRRGCDLDELLRFSRSARGPVLASEIAVIGPSADTARLVALIEAMLIGIVLGYNHGES